MINTTVVCFWRRRDDGKRRGIWAMTGEKRGVFFHGGRNEWQAPHYSRTWLLEMASLGGGLLDIEKITPADAMHELRGWPDAQRFLQAAFDRHPRLEAA